MTLPGPPPVRATAADVDAMRAVGAALADVVAAGDVVVLTGDLGAGKTVLTQGLATALGIDAGEVTSPTFALVSEHHGAALRLLHADVYRLDTAAEIVDLGLAELVEDGEAIAVIEWGEKAIAAGALPSDRLDVELLAMVGGEQREISMWLRGPSWEARRGRLLVALAVSPE